MQTTWTNQRVALQNDLVFGLVVLTESGWHPVSQLDASDLKTVVDAVDNNASCPYLSKLRELQTAQQKAAQ